MRRFANAELELVLPVEVAERLDVLALASQPGIPQHRTAALALGLCWPRFRRFHRYSGDALAYSALVERVVLVEQKQSFAAMMVVAREALELVLSNLPAIEGAKDFTKPPDDGIAAPGGSWSGDSSSSSAPGESTQAGSESSTPT